MKHSTPIALIIQLLQTHPFEGISPNIEIAKGRYEYNRNLKQVFKQFKRRVKLLWNK